MKWGVRRTDDQISKASKKTSKKSPASKDSETASASAKKAKKSGVSSLSNAELKELNKRLNLVQNYSRLTDEPTTLKSGKAFVKKTVGTVQDVTKFAKSPIGKMVAKTVTDSLAIDFSKIKL
jgi:hypothetical protein